MVNLIRGQDNRSLNLENTISKIKNEKVPSKHFIFNK
jgi:hypothetical protein